MSNAVNDLLKEEFMQSLEKTSACPYCGNYVSMEPTDACCGEVHAEVAWEASNGEIILDSELPEAFQVWLRVRGEV